jgi:hypothetical protein
VVLAVGIQVGLPSAAAAPAPASGTQKVIVILRDQLASTPVNRTGMSTRTTKADQSQRAVLARLAGAKPSHVTHYSVGNAFSATVTAAQATALAADAAVASVVKDTAIAATPTPAPAPSGSQPKATPKSSPKVSPADGPNAICPADPSKPLLEPEALGSIHALTTDGSPNAQQLSTGVGVKVAYIADGIDPNNPDFIRPNGQHVIIDYKDFSGDGPDAPSGGAEAFGDASSIAAQGTVSHDLSQFVNQAHPLPAGCNIKIVGVAPGASIVALKAGGEFLTNSSILQSIDYAVRVDHVDVINESFGLSQFPDDSSRNTVELFNDQAVAAGVTITESSGDGGVTGTIGSDAQDPKVISAGATTDNRLYAQTTYAAEPFSNGKWINDNISALSSSGFTQLGRTVDLVAPGEGNWAACEPGFANCLNFQSPPQPTDLQSFGGTSESAPLTAGVAALVISAYRSTHHNASPTPAVVKKIITGTTHDLGLPPYEQGSGLLDARASTEAALTWPGASTSAPASVKSNIVTSPNQLTLTGRPGSTQSATTTVRNVGNKTVTVAAGTRGYATKASSAQTVAFDSTTLPTFTYYNGAQWAYKKATFTVPAGSQRLLSQMAWTGSRPGLADTVVRLTLLAPDGTFVANSRPQGGAATANYANVDVRNPAAGTWTAIMYSVAGPNGFTGNIQLGTTAQRAVPVGRVSPANFTLAPGASRAVKASFPLPARASGDQDYAITLASSGGHQTSVSAIVRPVIDTSSGTGNYSGVVTGGNARAVTPGETFSYQFNVPKHRDDLDVSLQFKHNPNSILDLVLLDPNGELADVVTNETVNSAGTALVLKRGIQSFNAAPLPGTWHLVVVVQNPVSGTTLAQPFTGKVTFDRVGVSAPALPDSARTKVHAGTPITVKVTVTNPGVQAILVGVDPRLDNLTTLQPVPIGGSTTFDLPPDPAQEPVYSIPPDTKSLTVTASSTTPAQLELQGSAAGFDLFGDLAAAQQGNSLSVAKVSEPGPGYISKGIWFTNMQQIGPFTDAGAPTGQSTITASMRTLAFDPTVTSSTDDPFRASVDATSDGFGTPVRIAPGETKTITVVITPSGAKGKTVSGVLNLVTVPNLPAGSTGLPQTTTGEVIQELPYSYTIG